MGDLGAPEYELSRSPVASRIGELARRNGLFLSHFEHRLALELPEDWIPSNRPDLGYRPEWQNGVLAEAKYLSFRHDRLLGSFHPGHRAKWTAHELCHGIVGFAWAPSFGLFEQAVAARIAEILPVAVYYFFDEAGLQRCDMHANGGPLFSEFCEECERRAALGSKPSPRDDYWLEAGVNYVERELLAVERSLQTRRIIPHRLGNLELGSDGLAYAAAHAPRLASPTFHMFIERFVPTLQGRFDTLEGLLSHTRLLTNALVEGEPSVAWARTDRNVWIAQDIGYRLLTIWTETCEGPDKELLRIIDSLADSPENLQGCINEYIALCESVDLPAPEDLFAVGYPIGPFGSSIEQLLYGLHSAIPYTCAHIDDLSSSVRGFANQDAPHREPLPIRFAKWLKLTDAGPRDAARYEAALSTAKLPSAEAITLAPQVASVAKTVFRLAPHVQVLMFDSDIPTQVDAHYQNQPVPIESGDVCVCIFQTAERETAVLPVTGPTREVIEQLLRGPMLGENIPIGIRHALLSHSVILPDHY